MNVRTCLNKVTATKFYKNIKSLQFKFRFGALLKDKKYYILWQLVMYPWWFLVSAGVINIQFHYTVQIKW